MMIIPLILALELARARPDTITADSLLHELRTLIAFRVVVAKTDTLVNGLFLANPPTNAKLAVVQAELPFALTWLLEGAPSYDRRRLLEKYGSDTTAMSRAFFDAIEHDRRFTTSVLRLATPLLRARGTVVTNVVPYRRPTITKSDAAALAARFFQVIVAKGKVGMSICSKPHLLRDRPLKRDDVVEAWFYSAVRPRTSSNDLSVTAVGLLKDVEKKLGKAATKERLQRTFWRRLASEPMLRHRIESEYARTAAWAPWTLVTGR